MVGRGACALISCAMWLVCSCSGDDASDPAPAGAELGVEDTTEPVEVPVPDDPGAPPADPGAAPEDGEGPADLPPQLDEGAPEPDEGLSPPDPGTNVDACEPLCSAGDTSCDEDGLLVTCTDGPAACPAWGPGVACPDEQVCSEGQCTAPCDPFEDTLCLNEAVLQTCYDGALSTEECEYGCDVDLGMCLLCKDGAWRCDPQEGGGFQMKFCDDGVTWKMHVLCPGCACSSPPEGVNMVCTGVKDVATDCTMCSDDGLSCE